MLRRRTPIRRTGWARGGRPEREARRIRRIGEEAQASGVALSGWEETFLADPEEGLEGRLERHGRAFAEPALAAPWDPEGPLSLRQKAKVRQIERKVRGTGGGGQGNRRRRG